MRIWIYGVMVLGMLGCSGAPKNPWREVQAPSRDPAEAIGSYSAGCLKGAESLYPEGEGYQVMRISRRRFYGHPNLIRFVEKLSKTARRKKLGTLLIGDLAQPRGGPTLSGHVSHQSGLDVDIWFELGPGKILNLDARENRSAPSVVRGDKVTNQWTPAHVQILKLAALDPEVERIFVNPAIKLSLCSNPKNASWQKKIRAWYGHSDHFHVRLRCPADSPLCTPQDAIEDDGSCDEVFMEGWFSEAARLEAAEKARREVKPPEMPDLPEACEALVRPGA